MLASASASVCAQTEKQKQAITAHPITAHPITAHLARRLLPADAAPIDGAVLIEQGGRIIAVGPRKTTAIPPGAIVVDHGENWLSPGFVDLHHHVSSGGGDINEMVMPLNAEMRTFDLVKPSAAQIKRCVAGGVTTTLFIPGSGTFISGFGTLLKMRGGGTLEAMIIKGSGR